MSVYWWSGISAYCAASWCVGYKCLRASADVELAALIGKLSLLRKVLFLFVALLILPFVLPVCAMVGWRDAMREQRVFRWLLRNHREFVFDRLEPCDLPEETLEYFQKHTPELVELGFQLLGDYLLKGEPTRFHGRCFVSKDGVTFATLCEIFGQTEFSMVSLFDDYGSVETTSATATDTLERVNQRDKMRAVFVPGATISEGYEHHRTALAEFEQDKGALALAFSPDQLRDVHTFQGRAYSRELFEIGERDDAPSVPELPRGVPTSVVGD
jgi:hypothetical protein